MGPAVKLERGVEPLLELVEKYEAISTSTVRTMLKMHSEKKMDSHVRGSNMALLIVAFSNDCRNWVIHS